MNKEDQERMNKLNEKIRKSGIEAYGKLLEKQPENKTLKALYSKAVDDILK